MNIIFTVKIIVPISILLETYEQSFVQGSEHWKCKTEKRKKITCFWHDINGATGLHET